MTSRIRWGPIWLLQVPNLLSGMSNGVVTIAVPCCPAAGTTLMVRCAFVPPS